MRTILLDKNWKVKTTVCWGERDRWLTFDGVEDFCKDSKQKLITIPNVRALLAYAQVYYGWNVIISIISVVCLPITPKKSTPMAKFM